MIAAYINLKFKIQNSKFIYIVGFAILMLCLPANCLALAPDEILVVANRNAAKSISIARYYLKKRQIPEENLILLWVTDKETCSREEYDKKIAIPIKRHILSKFKPGKIRCLLTVYGVPLKINTIEASEKETAQLKRLEGEKKDYKHQLKTNTVLDNSKKDILQRQIQMVESKVQKLRFNMNTGASVDSELALVMAEDYDIGGWQNNPYFVGFQKQTMALEKKEVLMVSRLDGPNPETVRRMIDDSLVVEENGLDGTAYIDARWPEPEDTKSVSGYALYDKSLHKAADIIRKSGRMPVTLEETSKLFAPGQCKSAALYCGWYSLARYVDAFQWQPGAIGYHIASSECATLKSKNSQVWCKRMIEEGVAATIGPVGEPYVQSFPLPEIFFSCLTEGYLSLAECYLVSVPFLSWKQVLIGDPLYKPFKNTKNGDL